MEEALNFKNQETLVEDKLDDIETETDLEIDSEESVVLEDEV